VHRRRSEELRDTRSPTPRRSEKRYSESSDEDDVTLADIFLFRSNH
jgi:hypothetical protein